MMNYKRKNLAPTELVAENWAVAAELARLLVIGILYFTHARKDGAISRIAIKYYLAASQTV